MTAPAFDNELTIVWRTMASRNPQRLGTQLTEWIALLKNQSALSRKDRLSPEHFERLKKLCSNRPVTIRLAKIVKNAADATQTSKSFLLAVCKESPPKLTLSATPPSIRQRKLSQIAKAAHKLAMRIQRNSIAGVIPAGTDRLEFLKDHLYDSALILPLEDESAGMDYDDDEDGYPNPMMLSNLMDSLAGALNGQAERVYSLPTHRITSLNSYVDSLAKLSRVHLGRVDRALIVNITYVITGESITQDMVRKRHGDKPTS
jgi:hypothetical protein